MPQPGVYFIVSTNAPLAVNFNGVNNPLTIDMLNGSPPQKWRLVGPPGGMQSIIPVVAPDYQTSPQAGFVAPDPPPFQWNLAQPGDVSTIVDVGGERPLLWTMYEPVPGTRVALAEEGAGSQNWEFRNAE